MTPAQEAAYHALLAACEAFIAWQDVPGDIEWAKVTEIDQSIRDATWKARRANDEADYLIHQEQLRAERKKDVVLFGKELTE
jgi:hypothetical protein